MQLFDCAIFLFADIQVQGNMDHLLGGTQLIRQSMDRPFGVFREKLCYFFFNCQMELTYHHRKQGSWSLSG